jgi:Ca2+-binding RTX toxin-like protein
MQGVYLYADFVSNQIWSFRVVNGRAVDAANRTAQLVSQGGVVDQIASFGEDGRGNLYIVGLDGEIFLIRPQAGAGDGADYINGGAGNDRILGGAGNDTLRGGTENDTLSGNGQNDRIEGGTGQDYLIGGAGADVFDFNAIVDSPATAARDAIADFGTGGDRIDLSGIDARAAVAGNQAFTFIGNAAFTDQGQIRAVQQGTAVILLVNNMGTAAPDMLIALIDTRLAEITASDFIL